MMRRWLLFLFVLMAAQGFADETDDVMSGQARQASAVSVFQSEQQAEELTKANGERIFFPASARTPLEAILGFRKFMRAGDYNTAGMYLDLRYIPEEVAQYEPDKLAQALSFVWSQQNVLDITSLSDSPEGHLDDGLPSYRDQVGEVQLSGGRVPIYVQRIPDPDGGLVWRVSNATVAQIPEMWEEHGFSEFAIWLAKSLPPFSVLGMTNWQAVSMFSALVLLWFVAGLLSQSLSWLSQRMSNRLPAGLEQFFRTPMRLIIYVLLFRAVIEQLGLSITARVYLQSSPLEYLAGTVLIIGLITVWRDYKLKQLEISGNLHLAALLKPIVLIAKIIVAVIAALVWAHNAGFNISTLIAGLGVGSLAIALAAQRTMENVIGAATLYAARPIRPGDLCRFGDITGVVEEIGLRSVTLRSLDRTLVSIPNSKFAAEQIENISVRDRIRFFKRLQLQMPTSEQLRVILGELREMLAAHPRIQQDTVSVRLENIEAANAVLRLDSGIVTQNFQDYLAVAEDLNLRIIEIVHANGAIFSGPGQVLQLREFHQASDELMAEVKGKLDTWRDNQQFPFPDVSDDRKAEIEASLTYPPLGSGQDTRDK